MVGEQAASFSCIALSWTWVGALKSYRTCSLILFANPLSLHVWSAPLYQIRELTIFNGQHPEDWVANESFYWSGHLFMVWFSPLGHHEEKFNSKNAQAIEVLEHEINGRGGNALTE
jgi:hypothetical protein